MKASPGRLWVGGLVGPSAFVAAWLGAGAAADGYSPVEDAISRLAAQGAATRAVMTGGFVAFGIGVPLYAAALRRTLPGCAWVAATASGVATLGVALFPLDQSRAGDRMHAVFAGAGYAALALTPVLAAPPCGVAVSAERRSPRWSSELHPEPVWPSPSSVLRTDCSNVSGSPWSTPGSWRPP